MSETGAMTVRHCCSVVAQQLLIYKGIVTSITRYFRCLRPTGKYSGSPPGASVTCGISSWPQRLPLAHQGRASTGWRARHATFLNALAAITGKDYAEEALSVVHSLNFRSATRHIFLKPRKLRRRFRIAVRPPRGRDAADAALAAPEH